ncbi:MAG: diacylglycerol kinase family lipid kinase [Oscillospiraceae bacterium]|nr:diacylglycerol kinase family lipid kinase [Oscillospiraceae bacterium]
MKKMLLFVNPNAGRDALHNNLLELIRTFTVGGYDVTVRPTLKAKDITEQLLLRGEDFDCVVSCGGDGTLNETVSGLVQLKRQPLFGYLPAGTVNDFAHSLGISRKLSTAARDIVSGAAFECDVGTFNDRYFAYVAAFGAFTAVAYETPHEEKQVLGRTAYILNGIRSLTEIRPYHVRVEHDGIVSDENLLLGMVTNTVSVGGFKASMISDSIQLDDGLFEVVLVRSINSLLDFNTLTASLIAQDLSGEHFSIFTTGHLKLTFDEDVPWTLDGEAGGGGRTFEISNRRRAYRILVPKKSAKDANGL